MKIGILGGSFDPIHNGHLHMAREALIEYALDEVWLMPAGQSPNKNASKMTSSNVRKRMCELACLNETNIKVCSLETESDETSYTFRTLQKLTERFPSYEFYFIMGADSLAYFEKWVHPEIISQLAALLVVNRDEYSMRELEQMAARIKELFPADIRFVHCAKYEISSHELRDAIWLGQHVEDYLPMEVFHYISQNKLYR